MDGQEVGPAVPQAQGVQVQRVAPEVVDDGQQAVMHYLVDYLAQAGTGLSAMGHLSASELVW